MPAVPEALGYPNLQREPLRGLDRRRIDTSFAIDKGPVRVVGGTTGRSGVFGNGGWGSFW